MTATTILVLGATGTQGGAVADHLLADESGQGFDVHALTRNPDSEAARSLADRGATVVEGNLKDKESLRPAVEDVDGIFAVTDFWEAGYEDEITEGINVAEVAAEIGVDHYVFSSVGGAERDTGIAHFDSKYEIERRIAELDLPATIVRPVFFMQNFEGQRGDITDGTLAMPLAEGVSLQMLDVDTLGAFVARAFANPEKYLGNAYELASDEHTLESAADVFSAVIGTDVEPVHVPIDAAEEQLGEEYAVMFEWFNEHGYEANLEELQRNHDVEFVRLEEYLRKHRWDNSGGVGQ